MCIIVDNCVAAPLLLSKSPVQLWLLGTKDNPRLVVGGQLTWELSGNAGVQKLLVELNRAGRLRIFRHIPPTTLGVSNDRHILALAMASGARTLCTSDRALMADFRNSAIINRPRGKVYTKPDHKRLLGHTPSSCGVKSE
jgi:predicted nucleic acid-binding protein